MEIAEIIGCSRKMIYNVVKCISADHSLLKRKKDRKNPPRKTTLHQDRAIVRKSKLDPFKSSRTIMAEINEDFGLNVSARLVRRRLNENNLFGRVSRKNLFCQKRMSRRDYLLQILTVAKTSIFGKEFYLRTKLKLI